jgi:hypothetical protein
MARALLAAILALVVGERAAGAFIPDGHEVLEALAYRDLIARDHVAGTGVGGRQIIAFLIRRGVLARPHCFDAKPDEPGCGQAARREEPVDFWPILGSGSLDLLLSRQFGQRGQCFHFMADTPDARTPNDPRAGVPLGLSVNAYGRCMRLATSLFDEILRDPYAASIRGRGTYVLLHMLTDSFSPAHVERGPDGHIHHLKVWVLRNGFLFDLRAFDPKIHHGFRDPRDRGFIDPDRVAKGKPCGKYVAAYEVPRECLTPDGKEAVATLVDLMVTLYAIIHHAGDGAEKAGGVGPPVNFEHEQGKSKPANPTSLDDEFARDHWKALLARHFASDYAPLTVEKQHDDEQGWQPNLLIAPVFRIDTAGGGWDAGLRVAWMQVVRQALPLIPLESFTLGYGRFDGSGRWLSRLELSFLMPIWDRLGIGASPVSLGFSCWQDFSSCRGDVLSLPVRLSYFSDLGFWIDVTGPEYSWIDRTWSHRLGFSIGAAFDILDRLNPSSHRDPRPAHAEAQAQGQAEAEPPWDPPPMPDLLRYHRPPSFAVFVEGAVIDAETDHQIAAGFEIRRERDADNRRAGLGWGLELSYQNGALDDHRLDDVRIVPGLRYYLIAGFLSLRVSPLALAIGKWGDDFFLDAGVDVALSVSLSGLEISVGGPRLSYVHRAQNRMTPLALRVSWRWRD